MICRFSLGDTEVPFSMQSCSKPFTYAICLNELGSEVGPSVGAQSIARGHIDIGHICQRNEIFKKTIFTKKGLTEAADSWPKNHILSLKVENDLVPKSCYYFFRNFASNSFHRWRLFADCKTWLWKVSRTPIYIHIERWGYDGENFLIKINSKPRFFSERWSTSAQSIAHAQRLARFNFAAKKAHVEAVPIKLEAISNSTKAMFFSYNFLARERSLMPSTLPVVLYTI